MKIRRKILLPISALVFIMILAMIVIADVPPPPVNQNIPAYDTMVNKYNEPLCRTCHTTTGTIINGISYASGGVPTRHHRLVANNTINPYTNSPFQCPDCHPLTGTGNNVLMDRNCIDCHMAIPFFADQTFGAKVGNFTKPHHNTTQAQSRNCKFCHGANVDNYNDGHYVPSYPEDPFITPTAMFKIFNSSSGRVWGGCLACHAENASANPPIYFTHTNPSVVNGKYNNQPVPDSTLNLHHEEILNVTGVPEQPTTKCSWCHILPDTLDVRGCETCHSVSAIHNTQFDYSNTSTLIGYGHIGSNNATDTKNYSWDCNGCHASWNAGDVAPLGGAIIPAIQEASPTVLYANTPTVITLTGTNFVQANNTVVINLDDNINLAPTTIDNGKITATVNLPAGNHYIKAVKTDAVENIPKPTNIIPLTVVNKVTISSAKVKTGIITITGSGFGKQPVTNSQQYVTIGHTGKVYYSDNIVSWSDTQIRVKSSIVARGDTVTVITVNSDEGSSRISSVVGATK